MKGLSGTVVREFSEKEGVKKVVALRCRNLGNGGMRKAKGWGAMYYLILSD